MIKQISLLVLFVKISSSFSLEDVEKSDRNLWKAIRPTLDKTFEAINVTIVDLLERDQSNFTFLLNDTNLKKKKIAKIHVIRGGQNVSNKCKMYNLIDNLVNPGHYILKFDLIVEVEDQDKRTLQDLFVKSICITISEDFDEIASSLSSVLTLREDQYPKLRFLKYKELLDSMIESFFVIANNGYLHNNLNINSFVYEKIGVSHYLKIANLENMTKFKQRTHVDNYGYHMRWNDPIRDMIILERAKLISIAEKICAESKVLSDKKWVRYFNTKIIRGFSKILKEYNSFIGPIPKFLI
jgi:hypothetical protein